MSKEHSGNTLGKENRKNNPVQPDPETLHTPDPEKKMKGPVSTSLRKVGKAFESGESRKDADEKRDNHM